MKNLGAKIAPNILAYTSYVGGIAKSKTPDQGSQGEAVLERMKKFGLQRDTGGHDGCYSLLGKEHQ